MSSSSIVNTSTTLWDDPEIKKTVELMDASTRYKYQQMGKCLYDNNSLVEEKDIDSTLFDLATQIALMLRDGLSANMLTPEERSIFIRVFGENKLDDYSITNCNDEDDNDHLV
jgi:hypothetical protein